MLSATTARIGEAEIRRYEIDGVICLRGAFSARWIEQMGAAVDTAMAAPGPLAEDYVGREGTGRFFGDLDIWQRHPPFRRFVFQSPAAAIAGHIMRATRVNFFYDQLLVKEPGTSEATPWHQDQPYWAVSGRQVCSIWLPFDAVERSTCPQFVRASHTWPEFSPYHFADGTPYEGTGLPPMPAIEGEGHDILDWQLAPGDCLVFQAMIVHGAPANHGQNRRRALATRWVGDDARYYRRPGEVAIPTSDPGLADGAVMGCQAFPLAWSAS